MREHFPDLVARVRLAYAGVKHLYAVGNPGARVRAEVTVFAEGTRGSLAKGLFARHDLYAGKNPQTYGTGDKELWQVTEEVGRQMHGKVMHTGGHPLDSGAYGGSWVYGIAEDKLSLGFVVGLDHGDARLDPHAEFVRWKQHPRIQSLLEGGKCLRYGAKTVPDVTSASVTLDSGTAEFANPVTASTLAPTSRSKCTTTPWSCGKWARVLLQQRNACF